jgi:hypothetical protein
MTADEPHIPMLQRDLLLAAARLHPPLRRRRRAVGLALAGATAAASLAFVLGAGSDPHAVAVRAADDGLAAHFAPFRRPAEMPPADVGAGLDAGTARRLATPGAELWVGRGRGGQVCLSHARASGFAGACARFAYVLAEGLFSGGRPAPGTSASGANDVEALLPDGVSSVTFSLADGSRRAVAVVDNGLAAGFAAAPLSARFRDGAGVQHVVDLGDDREGRAQPTSG